jgi:hypothetical protein
MRSNPLRPISHTASELIAERVVARLSKLPPNGMSWRERCGRAAEEGAIGIPG